MQQMRIIALLMAITLFGMNVHGQDNDFPREESFVYATTYFDGTAYNSGVVTPNVETIYLLAGSRHVIAPRQTLIYYWSLTNEYLADWSQKNELVDGTLEVLQGNQVIEEITLTDFVIQYDANNILDTVTLIDGPDAVTAYEQFEQQQAAFREASFAYYTAQQAWELEMREIVRNNPPGTVAEEDLPVRPEPPTPFSLFSTDLISGYVLSLPVGTYQMRMRLPDGSIQPGGEKRLVMFEPLETGVSYQVTPKSRWTRPEESRRPNTTIYAPPGTTLYLRPYGASAMVARAYTRMNKPQDRTASANRIVWIPNQPLSNVEAIIQQANNSNQVALTPYYVRQLVRDSRGYDIIPWDTSVGEQPSFEGFQVDVSVNTPVKIQLIDESGQPISGSTREVRALLTERIWVPYVLSLLPVVVGLISYIRRRRVTHLAREGVE